ncbi:helix-turn-helix transcriptional regulator [Cohnella fermenti]|uniref:Helix-turn-helix transcriptional regulator n=2 Tax=Cohnella fermenti TaxID=2565925 RepID=A0A4S4BNL2_9BACL|nr:helix-turn-helix transcriptional regulator [Cohnella fermenti]
MLALLLGLSRAICDSRVGCTLLTDRHRAPNWLQQERTEMTRYIVRMHEAVSESPVSDAILNEWHRTIHFSYSHFHRLFKEQTGFAPHIYFTNLRMEKAAQLLLRTDLPVQEVAYRCGYDDAKYFSRQFRKSQGMSPTAFRERIRTGRLDDSE